MFALPDPPQPLSPSGARPSDRQATQWHATPTSGSLSQPHTLSKRALGQALSPRCAHSTMWTETLFGAVGCMNHDQEHVAAPNSVSVHWVFRYGPGVEALQHMPSPTSAARATLAPASSPRARRARHESPLQPRAPQPPARPPWPWRAASVARPSVRADQRGCTSTDFGRKVGVLPS